MREPFLVDFNPVMLSLGPLELRWYGVMYVIGFILAGVLARHQIKRGFFQITTEKLDGLITLMIICMFLGARLAYVFIYNWGYYQNNIGEILAVWRGGLSFHGALVGLIVAGIIFAKRNKVSWQQVMDNVALAGTPGLFFGRIGNFINGELYGRVTDHPIGMVFVHGGPYPRHPSQLYEAVLEGLVLSLLLWFFLPRVKHYGQLGAIFLFGYGFFRYIVEFFREPDAQLGYFFWGTTTMGQILCFLMMIGGLAHYLMSRRNPSLQLTKRK